MKIAVLFNGAGLARLGLEQAGHDCTGFEIDTHRHYLSKLTGSGNCIQVDATKVDLSGFDAVWASPPCQLRSRAKTQGAPVNDYADDYLEWCLNLPHDILWVENVLGITLKDRNWGKVYNAGQFRQVKGQNRNRIIGGRHLSPKVYYSYRHKYDTCSPCIMATEWKGCATDQRRASRAYGRKLYLMECAQLQGLPLDILETWKQYPNYWTDGPKRWKHQLYEAVGSGVPVYMAKAFGDMYA